MNNSESYRKKICYKTALTDLLCKSMDWFLCDNSLRHERVNNNHVLRYCICQKCPQIKLLKIVSVYFTFIKLDWVGVII